MNREELEIKIKHILADLLGIEEEIIKENSDFINDLNADSLDGVEMVMIMEDTFNIHITDEEAELAINFKLLLDLIESKIEK